MSGPTVQTFREAPSSHHRGTSLGHVHLSHRRRPTFRMTSLYIWVLVFSIAALQDIIPFYQSLRLRELTTLVLLVGVLTSRFSTRQVGFRFSYALFVCYVFVTAARSISYSIVQAGYLSLHVVQYSLLLLTVPTFARDWKQARSFLVFVLLVCVIGALTAPLQEVLGPFPWLDPEWALQHGRAGFARYQPLFGDPNVAGMIGGILPLFLFTLNASRGRSKTKYILTEVAVWSISVLLVAYSLSFTGILLFAASIVIRISTQEKKLLSVIEICLIAALMWIVFPAEIQLRIVGTIQRFRQPTALAGYSSTVTHLEGDVAWRLLEYWDLNDTAIKVLFGSTYDVVTPARYLHPSAILAHNGYKEMYLAGGLLGLGFFLALLLPVAWKALRFIFSNKSLTEPLRGISLTASWMYLLLLGVMLGFPLYHYNGIGIIFWCAAGVIHVLYDTAVQSTKT